MVACLVCFKYMNKDTRKNWISVCSSAFVMLCLNALVYSYGKCGLIFDYDTCTPPTRQKEVVMGLVDLLLQCASVGLQWSLLHLLSVQDCVVYIEITSLSAVCLCICQFILPSVCLSVSRCVSLVQQVTGVSLNRCFDVEGLGFLWTNVCTCWRDS